MSLKLANLPKELNKSWYAANRRCAPTNAPSTPMDYTLATPNLSDRLISQALAPYIRTLILLTCFSTYPNLSLCRLCLKPAA